MAKGSEPESEPEAEAGCQLQKGLSNGILGNT